MGDLTDEQLESVIKIGLDKTIDKIIEVITTCSNLSDKEILDICASNPIGAPQRLRIIRPKSSVNEPTVDPNEPTVAPNEPTVDPNEPTVDPNEPTVDPNEPTVDPNEPTVDPNEPADDPETVILTRKSTSTTTLTLDGTETKIKLTNSVDGKDYYYTLTTTDGNSHEVNLALLDNSNLLIQGSYIKVISAENQDDSLIIMGANNEIYTNSGNDI